MIFNFKRRVLIAAVRDAWPAWLALGGIAFAMVLAWRLSGNAPARVRYAGTVLQVFGLGTVAIGLSQVRRLFGRPSLHQKLLAWFRQIAATFLPSKPITVQANAAGIAIASGKARVVVRAGPDSSLDRRVAILEENLDRLRDEVDANEKRLSQELGAVRDALGHEQRAREAANRQIALKMEEFAIGGLHLESVGLTWLAFGVLGTGIPDELATLASQVVQLLVAPVRSLATLVRGW